MQDTENKPLLMVAKHGWQERQSLGEPMLLRGPEKGCPSGRTIGRLVRWDHPGDIRTFFHGVTKDETEEKYPSGRRIGQMVR